MIKCALFYGGTLQIELEFEIVGFEERRTTKNLEKNLSEQGRTYDADTGNRTRATLGGDECSHHCAINVSLSVETL